MNTSKIRKILIVKKIDYFYLLLQVIDPLSFWQNSVEAQAVLLLAPSDPVQSSIQAAKVTAAKAERKAKTFIFAFFFTSNFYRLTKNPRNGVFIGAGSLF